MPPVSQRWPSRHSSLLMHGMPLSTCGAQTPVAGGSPDPFEVYRSDTDYTNFTSSVGDIPDGLVSLRIVVEASTNSSSEHIIVDNLCVSTGVTPLEILEFPVSHSDRPEERLWEQFDHRWLDLARRGVPAGFGARTD